MKPIFKNRKSSIQKTVIPVESGILLPAKEELGEEAIRDTWMTPPHILRLIRGLTGSDFTIDLACSLANRVCPKGYTREDNSLEQNWDNIENGWCNPPYSRIGPWIDKACRMKNSRVSFLLPASTSTKWFYKASQASFRWYLFNGRIEFLPPEGIKASTPRGDNVLFLFDDRRPSEGFSGFLPSKVKKPKKAPRG